ncbi:MAG: SDR family oxidoreductase [Alphaproteobacteria bacterium]|nr:SDR family oxidoreductase [Alphaproteobacteria bacterium]
MVSFDISGKAVLIVGGTGGIGTVLAREFARVGTQVTIAADDPEVVAIAADLSRETNTTVAGFFCDVTDLPSLRRVVDAMPRIDVLINNAGIAKVTAVSDQSPQAEADFRRTIDVNLNGLYWATQEALRKMGEGGRIVFTASIWGKTAGPEFAAYVASKHGVIGLVRSLAMELGPRGITVNAVCPGTIATKLNLTLPPGVIDKLTGSMWIRRGAMIPPEDLAGVYVFLASPAASEITGQAFNVDRGQHIA